MVRSKWTMGLGLAAVVAMWFAPRLGGATAPSAPVVPQMKVAVAVDPLPTPAPIAPVSLPLPEVSPTVLPMKSPAHAPQPLIPELSVPVEPLRPIEPFWDNCPACGMG